MLKSPSKTLCFLIHLFCFVKKKFLYLFAASGVGLLGEETFLQKHIPSLPTLGARQEAYSVEFDYDANFGIPGAFYIKNYMQCEFFLVSLTLEDIPNHGTIRFDCNSWVYNFKLYNNRHRIFFTNDVSSVPSSEFLFNSSSSNFLELTFFF